VRRNWRRLALAVLVLATIGLATAGLFWAATRGPLVSAVASRLLGRRVEISTISVLPGRSLQLELTGLRVFDPGADEPVLEVQHARASQSWPWLLAGQLLPRRWELDAPVVRLRLGEAGTTRPLDLPPLDLSLRDGTIEIVTPGGERYRVVDLALDLKRSRLRPNAKGTAVGELWRGDQLLGRAEAEVDGWLDDATATLQLDGVQLDSLPFDLGAKPSGTARGQLRLHYARGRIAAEVDMRVSRFRLRLPGLPERIAPANTRVQARIKWGPERVSVEARRIALDDLVLSGSLWVGSGPRDRVRADLEFADFAPGRAAKGRVHPLMLMGLRFSTWARADARIEGGRIEGLKIHLDVARKDLADSLAFKSKLRPEQLRVTARVSRGVYRTSPSSDPLEDIHGELEVAGNRLVIRELRMSRSGKPLPTIDVDLDGMHRLVRLPKAERGTPKGPGVPIPGLGPAARALRSPPEPGREPVRIELREFALSHPAFIMPLRDVTAELTFPDGKLRMGRARGVYGGAPAELELLWDPRAERVRLDVRYLDGAAPPPADRGELWMSGRATIPLLRVGRWRLEDTKVNVAAQGATVSFDGGRALLGGGDAQLHGTVSLASEGRAPIDISMRTVGADMDAANDPLTLPAGALTGRADVDGRFRGVLEPGRPFLSQADFEIDVRATDGSVSHLPVLVALARLPSLQGVRGLFGRPLPYDELTGRFTLREGVLRTENLSLTGPELRLLAAGDLRLLEPGRPRDILFAFLFLQTVDRVIDMLPVIGDWVLGEDDNLVTLYVRVQGPQDELSASLVAPDSVRTAAGWAERMIGAGVNQLKKLLSLPRLPGSAPPTAPEAPEDSSDLSRPG